MTAGIKSNAAPILRFWQGRVRCFELVRGNKRMRPPGRSPKLPRCPPA